MKTMVYVGTSLDGFLARANGDIRWLTPFEDSVRGEYSDFISGIDAIVIGRGTYETVLTFPSWPYQKKVFVLSRTIRQLPEKLSGKAMVLSMEPKKLLAHLSDAGFSNIYVDGGKVIQSFLREDCIDELIITKVPVLLGSGISLFGDLDNDLAFRHLQTKVFSNGLVRSHYERSRG